MHLNFGFIHELVPVESHLGVFVTTKAATNIYCLTSDCFPTPNAPSDSQADIATSNPQRIHPQVTDIIPIRLTDPILKRPQRTQSAVRGRQSLGGKSNRAVALMSTTLYSVRVHARCIRASQLPGSGSLAPIEVDIFNVESVNVSREVAKDRETDVDE